MREVPARRVGEVVSTRAQQEQAFPNRRDTQRRLEIRSVEEGSTRVGRSTPRDGTVAPWSDKGRQPVVQPQ